MLENTDKTPINYTACCTLADLTHQPTIEAQKIKNAKGRANINFYNIDNIEFMKTKPDNYYKLAICDPPYGLGNRLVDGAGKVVMKKYKKQYNEKQWDDVPTTEYWEQLFRVSQNQIVWGGNYFPLPPTRGIVCWDKKQMMPTFSRWEYAWTSFDKPAKMFEHFGNNDDRFHVTEKPYELYKWLLHTFAKEGWNILDTHGGSMSIAKACWDYKFDLDICEIDEEYFRKGYERFYEHTRQTQLF